MSKTSCWKHPNGATMKHMLLYLPVLLSLVLGIAVSTFIAPFTLELTPAPPMSPPLMMGAALVEGMMGILEGEGALTTTG